MALLVSRVVVAEPRAAAVRRAADGGRARRAYGAVGLRREMPFYGRSSEIVACFGSKSHLSLVFVLLLPEYLKNRATPGDFW